VARPGFAAYPSRPIAHAARRTLAQAFAPPLCDFAGESKREEKPMYLLGQADFCRSCTSNPKPRTSPLAPLLGAAGR
jgi:hypothetical protein